jgi:hypothetical protein
VELEDDGAGAALGHRAWEHHCPLLPRKLFFWTIDVLVAVVGIAKAIPRHHRPMTTPSRCRSEQLSDASGSHVVALTAGALVTSEAASASSTLARAGAGMEELKSSPMGSSESSGKRKVELGRTWESEVVMAAEDGSQGSGGW